MSKGHHKLLPLRHSLYSLYIILLQSYPFNIKHHPSVLNMPLLTDFVHRRLSFLYRLKNLLFNFPYRLHLEDGCHLWSLETYSLEAFRSLLLLTHPHHWTYVCKSGRFYTYFPDVLESFGEEVEVCVRLLFEGILSYLYLKYLELVRRVPLSLIRK